MKPFTATTVAPLDNRPGDYAHLEAAARADWLAYKHGGDAAARARLVERCARQHERLAIWAYQRAAPRLPPHDPEDGIQAARLFLIDAVDHYDIDHPAAVRFATFAVHHIAYSLRKYGARVLAAGPLERAAVSLEELTEGWEAAAGQVVPDVAAGIVSAVIMEEIVRAAEIELNPREFACFTLRFLQHEPLAAVEAALDLTHGAARAMVRRIQKRLRPKLRAAGLAD